MKNFIFAIILIASLVGCAGAPNTATAEVSSSEFLDASFSDITDKDWKLMEMRLNGVETLFSRETLILEGFGEYFTIKFDAEIMSGVGAPNRYSAPYTLGEGQAINILMIRSTLMASIFEPEKLKEHEYFVYLQNVYEWGFVNNKLHLNSKTADGSNATLIFGL